VNDPSSANNSASTTLNVTVVPPVTPTPSPTAQPDAVADAQPDAVSTPSRRRRIDAQPDAVADAQPTPRRLRRGAIDYGVTSLVPSGISFRNPWLFELRFYTNVKNLGPCAMARRPSHCSSNG
jgi:hypothetical protein